MSELKRARERLMKGSAYGDSESEFSESTFRKSPHAQSIPKLHKRLDKEERFSEMEELDSNQGDNFSQFSPDISRTGRVPNWGAASLQFDNKSERVYLFDKEPKKQRRVTQFDRGATRQASIPKIIDYPDKENSIYNESPGKVVKTTVHNTALSFVISNPPVRKAYSPAKPHECDKEARELQVRQEKSRNSNFTDVMFPPRFSIIFNKKYMYLEEGLKFERITKIYEEYKTRLIKFCEPSFIMMGKFTSPALYSALAILSEEPSRVLSLIGHQEQNQNGIYSVQLCQDGIWKYVIIDDFMPVKILLRRSLLFAHTVAKDNTHEFWPAIVEKALAKIYGTYQDLFLTAHLGIGPIMRALTGFPLSVYELNKDFRVFLVMIDKAIKKKQIVVLESISDEYLETGHVKKLEGQQSYQILQVKKNYVLLRNLNEKELTTKLTFEQTMIFRRLLIFKNETNYIYSAYKLRHKKKFYSVLKVTLPQPTKCYWEVWEKNEAYYKNHIGSSISYRKSPFQILIKHEASEEQTYESTGQTPVITQLGKEVDMRKGVSYVHVHLCQERELDFVLSYYGEADAKLERVKNMEQWQLECLC